MRDTDKKPVVNSSTMIAAAATFAAASLAVFLLRAIAGLNLFEWSDETEKFVAAQMVNQGMRLYRDVFAHHGPFPYVISHLYVKLVSAHDFSHIRWAVVLLALFSCASIYFSPLLKSGAARLWGAGTYLSLLSSIWVLQGMHMLLYPSVNGFLLVIPTAQLFVPLFFGELPLAAGAALSGLAVIAACFTSYSVLPSAAMIVLSSSIMLVARFGMPELRRCARNFALGAAIGLVFFLLWLLLYGDLKGYFVYHFYFNQRIYSQFINFGFERLRNAFLFSISLNPESIVRTFALAGLLCWFSLLAFHACRAGSKTLVSTKMAALCLLFVSVVLSNPRGGGGFTDSGFVILNIALFAVGCAWCIQACGVEAGLLRTGGPAILVLLCVFSFERVSQRAVSSPHRAYKRDFARHVSFTRPSEEPIYELVRSVSKPHGDVLALIFKPIFYIRTDRSPASGHYYFLPWQAAYNEAPIAGYRMDLCRDIESRRPAVIWFDDHKVWKKYSIGDYQPCVTRLIEEGYRRLEGDLPIFLRSDLSAGGI